MEPLKKINIFRPVLDHQLIAEGTYAIEEQHQRSTWTLSLKGLCLKEKMEIHYPYMFDPSHHLTLIVVAWDYGKIWQVQPELESSQIDHYQIPIARKNTRRLKVETIQLFTDKKIKGSINLLIFITGKNDLHKKLNIKNVVEKSTLFKLIKKIKKKPALAPNSNLKEAVQATTTMMSTFAKKNKISFLPILEASYDKSQIIDSKDFKIEHESFEIILEFKCLEHAF